MQPKMIVVAGPPGSGKSSLYPVSGFGVPFFNADDRAAELNGGSYAAIPQRIRQQVNREFEAFVLLQIQRGESFALETTLRGESTFEQAKLARSMGFTIEMRYLALASFAMHLQRVKARSDAGGHSASETTLRRIYQSSLANIPRAVHEMDRLWVFDNSSLDVSHPLILEAQAGVVTFVAADPPAWLTSALPNLS